MSTLRNQAGTSQEGSTRLPASCAILDSTLREGEQFAGAFFTLEQRLAIARLLDAVGVAFIEIPSPIVSGQARQSAYALCELGLRAHIVAHVRCVKADMEAALDTPVVGL